SLLAQSDHAESSLPGADSRSCATPFGNDRVPEASQSWRQGAIVLKLGTIEEQVTPTPEQRRVGNDHVTAVSDYLSLAVAVQLVLLLPDDVCNVHSFEQLYGGRLLTDIIPQTVHKTFDGKQRKIDHTKDAEDMMRLHADDADHVLRSPLQLLTCIKNVKRTESVFALIPPDSTLGKYDIDSRTLRRDIYEHAPPASLVDLKDRPPRRPVLFGPADAPSIQADKKGTKASEGPEKSKADEALTSLFSFLEKEENLCRVVLGPGDVLVLDNLRTLHGRAALQPVPRREDRRWVKRLWLSSTTMEPLLSKCSTSAHPRVFDRNKAFWSSTEMKHPQLAAGRLQS
ncbi:unnamed protein product, partial [Effrenium voratum]